MFDEKKFSYTRLDSLVKLAENGTIKNAASKKGGSSVNVWRQIKELEQALGLKLTIKKGHILHISPDGQHLAALLKKQQAELKAFSAESQNSLNSISLGAGDSLLRMIVLPQIPEIQTQFPNTVFHVRDLTSQEINSKISDFTLELGLLRKDAIRSSLESTPLGDDQYCLVVPVALAPDKTIAMESLSTLPFALMRDHFGQDFQRIVKDNLGHSFNVRVFCETFTQVVRLAQTEAYAAVIPTYAKAAFEQERYDKKFIFPKLDFLANRPVTICLVWNPLLEQIRKPLGPFIKAMAKQLKTAFK